MDDISPAIRRMTYAELGEARGISTGSAERLARRRRWARQIGNDGIARVSVPLDEADKRVDVRPGRQGGRPRGSPKVIAAGDIGEVIRGAIREVVIPLREQLDRERARADRAEADNAELRRRIAALEARRWWRRLLG